MESETLRVFDDPTERMIVGGMAGYVVAGPIGAIAGAYVGSRWE